MDTFSRYNQIQMMSKDEKKIVFTTNKDLCYYKVIPFSLKNASITY